MELIGVWIAAFLTLSIFSFLYKDNPIYKVAEHLFVGISTGYILVQTTTGTLVPNLIQPFKEALRGGPIIGYVRLGGLVLGIMLLFRLFPRWGWISRWPLALMVGIYAALRMTGLAQSDLVNQINGTFVSLSSTTQPWFAWQGASTFNHLVLIIGVASVLFYFFFSIEWKGPVKLAAGIGSGFLMITFGSTFGFAVLGRVSLLIGRVQDLYLFSEARYGYASIICAVIIILSLIVWERRMKKS